VVSEPVRVLTQEGGIHDGARVGLEISYPLVSIRWIVEHSGYSESRQFHDIQVRGTFAFWNIHTGSRRMGLAACYLEDRLQYALPFGVLDRWLFGALVEGKLARLFECRHRVTREARPRMRAHLRDN